MVKRTASVLPILIILFCFSCGRGEKWNSATFVYFDTVCEIKVFCSPQLFESSRKEVRRIFSQVEALFSPGKKNYDSPAVLALFDKAMQFYKSSDGYFDITVAHLSRLWGFLNKNYRIPSAAEIKKALDSMGMDKIKREKNKLVLLPGMELDWGSIAKGYGVDLASQALIKLGISRGFINAGGDLFCWGKNPSNSLWKIGIKHPRKSGYFGILYLTEQAMATTGDYQRYFIRNKVRYHHVFNPFTGFPAGNKQSVTVVGPSTLYCDALSTALFVSPNPEKILDKYPQYGAIIVDSKGNIIRMGKNFFFRII